MATQSSSAALDAGAPAPRRIALMGMQIDAVTERQAVARILSTRGGVTVTPNLDHLRQFRASEAVRRYYRGAELVPPDGMPLVWASRIMGAPLPERVAGSSMIWSVCAAAAERDLPVYLLGGDPGTAEAAAAVLAERSPALRVAGTSCPSVAAAPDPGAIDAMARELRSSGAAIVFVGLPLDKQIALIEPLHARAPELWFVGVGVSFSFVCGEVARAPAWMQRIGAEWLHRLVQEPRRLARRYLVHGVPLALRLLGGAAAIRLRHSVP